MIYSGDDQIRRVFTGSDEVTAIYRGDGQCFTPPIITFDDDNVKAICVANWGGNIVPNEITEMEAAAVTTLVPSGGSQSAFRGNTSIETFNELKYFTGLTTLNAAFRDCTNLTQITFPAAPLSGNTCLTDCVGKTKVKIVDLRPLKINQSVAVNVRLHVDSSAAMEEVYFPQMRVRTLYYAFSGWTKLKKIDFSRCDFGNMTASVSSQSTTVGTFGNCTSLTTIVGGFQGLGSYNGTGAKFNTQTFSLAACPITHDNAVEILESLGTPPVASASPKITFKASTYNTLTADEKAIATAKKWQVASA